VLVTAMRTRGMEKQLFAEELIPKQVAETLPAGYKLRPLQSGDYERGVLQVLEVLTTVGNISKQKYLGTIPGPVFDTLS
jgi:hypothetical protein